MHALVGELLQSIIHKPVFGHAAQALKNPSAHTHAEMRALARAIRAGMAGVVCTFIQHLKGKGL
jgi:hypothetical protein